MSQQQQTPQEMYEQQQGGRMSQQPGQQGGQMGQQPGQMGQQGGQMSQQGGQMMGQQGGQMGQQAGGGSMRLDSQQRQVLASISEAIGVCEFCAERCVEEADPSMIECIKLCEDVAELGETAIALLPRNSRYAGAHLQSFQQALQACAQECGRHPHEHCQDCAQTLQQTLQQIQGLSQGMGQGMGQTPPMGQ